MADGAQLLKMLEPAVRPVAPPQAPSSTGRQPFEARSFEDLLGELRDGPGSEAGTTPVAPGEATRPERVNALSALTGPAAIENASLRRLMSAAVGGDKEPAV